MGFQSKKLAAPPAVPERHLLCRCEVQRQRLHQWLLVQAGDLLQALKVVLLICGMLVYDEEVVAQSCQDEAKVELPNNLHAGEVFLLKDPLDLPVSCLTCSLSRVLRK